MELELPPLLPRLAWGQSMRQFQGSAGAPHVYAWHPPSGREGQEGPPHRSIPVPCKRPAAQAQLLQSSCGLTKQWLPQQTRFKVTLGVGNCHGNKSASWGTISYTKIWALRSITFFKLFGIAFCDWRDWVVTFKSNHDLSFNLYIFMN